MKGLWGGAVGIVLVAALLISCTSDHQHGPGGKPSDSVSALLSLKGLIDSGSSDSLKLTQGQVALILPVLKEWKANVSGASETVTTGYAKKITAALTDAQKAYRPQPPQGTRGPGNSDGGPPSGGPGGPGGRPDIGQLLDSLIQALS